MNRSVGGCRRIVPRRELKNIAEDRVPAAGLDTRRPFAVAHEHVDVVSGTHERLEHRGAHVTGTARQKHSHDRRALANRSFQ